MQNFESSDMINYNAAYIPNEHIPVDSNTPVEMPVSENIVVSKDVNHKHRSLIPESIFYRVLEESNLYHLEFRYTSSGEIEGVEDIQTIVKGPGRTASNSIADRNVYSVKKMPDEIVLSRGYIICPFGSNQVNTRFIQLQHVTNAFMIYSRSNSKNISEVEYLLEQLPVSAVAREESGRFYYRVLVPIELRQSPDLLSPVISRHVYKNAEEIIECSQIYQCPKSSVVYVKLAYEEGWLFETLNSGIKVLERLDTEPEIENGQFYYIVRIPVGIRVAPHIMAQRAGKGFKLHSVVEASQRFTPPGSKITYVRVCKEKGSRCTTTHEHARDSDTSRSSITCDNSMLAATDGVTFDANEAVGEVLPPACMTCHGGWVFEQTMDGQTVLERLEKPISRQVERLFYRVLEDVSVLPTPSFNSKLSATSDEQTAKSSLEQLDCINDLTNSTSALEISFKRKRLKNTLIECSERLVPAQSQLLTGAEAPELAFVKLRHDVGWICERELQQPHRLVLEQVHGYAVTRDVPTLYRIMLPVFLRSAPDFECPRLPGVPALTVGSVVESSLQYTPPGSRIMYVKISVDTAHSSSSHNSTNGWLFDRTPSGDRILKALDEEPEKRVGRFYYRVVAPKKEVLLSPERNGEVVKYLFENTIFAADMEYTLPRTKDMYVQLANENGWVALDSYLVYNRNQYSPPVEPQEVVTLERLSEEIYNLYITPPQWVSIGYPNRMWLRVPDESCPTILAEETLLQMQIFAGRNVLATSSQGRDNVPLSRKGLLRLENGTIAWRCTLEEMKHSASPLMFTFPWKQVWWIFETSDNPDDRHCVEVQHGLRGGFRCILLDGEILFQTRTVTDILWDSGSEFSFNFQGHVMKVVINLEGAFFSQYLQFYSYNLLVDEEEIIPITY